MSRPATDSEAACFSQSCWFARADGSDGAEMIVPIGAVVSMPEGSFYSGRLV